MIQQVYLGLPVQKYKISVACSAHGDMRNAIKLWLKILPLILLIAKNLTKYFLSVLLMNESFSHTSIFIMPHI
jgi:hypothetical protein